MTAKRAISGAFAGAALMAVTACSASFHIGGSMDEADVERELADQTGTKPDKVDCPGDLAGAVGETMTCTLTAGTDQLGVAVEVTAVEGSTVDFHIEVEGA